MRTLALLLIMATFAVAQDAPYDVMPAVEAPYYRVRFEASTEEGKLIFPVSYTMWVPPNAKTLRGVIVHQHGCGVGSCRSGQTGAFDLHWQALARQHDCALISPVYEQPEMADCQKWCDPRNGSDEAFQSALVDLGKQSGHPELATVPWALWGHSGGGHWAGGMLLLHPDRVAAAWLRSGVPMMQEKEGRPKPYEVNQAACGVPTMCNLGTKEGFTVTDGRFSGVWPGVKTFFTALRGAGGLVGIAVDPLTSHECGNQRYLAIVWFDACLKLRLPEKQGEPLRAIATDSGWLTPVYEPGTEPIAPVAASKFTGEQVKAIWLPTKTMAIAWQQYVKDTNIADTTPPPAPSQLHADGKVLTWAAEADLESGIAAFEIERDGKVIARIPSSPKNPFGRPIFQGLQYSDTPSQPLVEMRFVDETAEDGKAYTYRVIAENTVGLKSK
ncbi:alpha/beta hydrolase family protein [Blastopirellula marina]|uniref:Uncharacterized protein n=1 Tax=Blastopirellula marina TaxID=124 RepID=A0A2S8F9L3_9BACT|nr:hypothetical protein [Blastopirellula marina]PQO28847.1 hypothetical protein C5Y98_24075 [Blastopirellula marina]PTL42120.1 hypothetical protein C5Y97_24090 [Blastopirellula marina]